MPSVNFTVERATYDELKTLSEAIKAHCKKLSSGREPTREELAHAQRLAFLGNMKAANEFLAKVQAPSTTRVMDQHPLAYFPALLNHLLRVALDSLGEDKDARLAALLATPTDDLKG